MYKSFLVPYDKSDQARKALKAALELASAQEGSTIDVLYVAEIPDFSDPAFEAAAQMAGVMKVTSEVAVESQRQYYEAKREALIADAREVVGDFDRVKYHATSGKPQDAIAEFAATGRYDMIVMGCRGLGALRGALGSVSYAVLHSVSIPVLAVK